MIRYSLRALRALPILFKHYNDIDVYVEDTASRNIYEVLINRILNGRARVIRVFQVGNRHQVIEECKRQQGQASRRSVFIIDGDLEMVCGIPAPGLKGLYRLSVYCSENLLVSSDAVTEIAYECLPNMSKQDIYKQVQFEEYFKSIDKCLVNLFITYATAYSLCPMLKTAGYHVYELCETSLRHPMLDGGKVQKRRSKILQELIKTHSLKTVRREYGRIRKLCEANKWSALHIASGKTYILPLIFSFLCIRAHYKGRIESLKVQLARYCKLCIDEELKEAILNTARN
ncbi:MAG: DUF4435 domain-containing protein [bacterium]|nr:DUF4435 domain-containing protein [bacterium]